MEDEINLYEPVKCTYFSCFPAHCRNRKKTTIKFSVSYTKAIIIMRKYPATTIIIAVVTLGVMSITAGSDVLPNRDDPKLRQRVEGIPDRILAAQQNDLHPLIKPLFDHPVRDTSICLGGDGYYYLTGTTANRTGGPKDQDSWWYVNEGVRVWKSPDLKSWEPLGLVWSLEEDATWAKAYRRNSSGINRRALWAPDIHHLKGTFWVTYSMNYGGCGLLKSTTGKAEGPYMDVKTDGPLTGNIDASLFQDDDGSVYFVWQNGRIARMKDDMSDIAEEHRLLKPANRKHVGFEGAWLFKANGRYYLSCAEFNKRDGTRTYDCMIASADSLDGPWSDAYLAIPHAGHNMFFKDKQGKWWATYFGNDSLAAFRERPAILPVDFDATGKIKPLLQTRK